MYASAIARIAKLNRTTTYGILKELAAKGLVSAEHKKGATRYQSIAPELLPGYIERRGRELLDTREVIKKLIPQIKLLRAKGRLLPRIQFFEGRGGVEQAYEDTLENNKEKFLRNIVGMDAVYTKLDLKFVDYYLKKRTRLGIRDTYITPETEMSRKYRGEDEKYIRKGKFIPEKYSMDTEISIYDNKVGIFSYSLENPVAIIIEDETISATMKKLFDYIESTAT